VFNNCLEWYKFVNTQLYHSRHTLITYQSFVMLKVLVQKYFLYADVAMTLNYIKIIRYNYDHEKLQSVLNLIKIVV